MPDRLAQHRSLTILGIMDASHCWAERPPRSSMPLLSRVTPLAVAEDDGP